MIARKTTSLVPAARCRRWSLLAPALFIGFTALAAPAHGAGTPATAAIRRLLGTQTAAWNHHDLEGYMAGYWNSPALVFYAGGSVTRGWQATLDRYRRRYQGEGKEMGTLSFPSLDIQTLGQDVAFARGTWNLQLRDGKTLRGLFTIIVRRLPEGWRIVHDHSSAE